MKSIDRQLFESAQRGDRRAFDELLDLVRPQLRAFCLSRAGSAVRRSVDVEDILQDTALKAFQSLDRIQWQGERALFSWLCGIAQNVVYAHSRRCLRIARPAAEFGNELDELGSSPSQGLRREERFDRLERCMAALTPEQQQVIRLTCVEGLTTRAAAARMDRSEKTTYQLLWRGMKKLREVFGDTASIRLPADRKLNQ